MRPNLRRVSSTSSAPAEDSTAPAESAETTVAPASAVGYVKEHLTYDIPTYILLIDSTVSVVDVTSPLILLARMVNQISGQSISKQLPIEYSFIHVAKVKL